MLAAQELPGRGIHIVNSRNLSSGIGLTILLAAEMRDQGIAADEMRALDGSAGPARAHIIRY